MNRPTLIRTIAELSAPLDPIPTDTPAHIEPLRGIRAVVFDIYGTLFVSGSGDIGLATAENREVPMREALARAGMPLPGDAGLRTVDVFHAAVTDAQRRRAAEGVDYAEVEIRDVWSATLRNLSEATGAGWSSTPAQVERLAVDYECRVNPVWPMPGVGALLDALRARGLLLGIVSNAQFFTPLLFDALLGRGLDAFGFDPGARVYSYALRRAKPSPKLYELLISHPRKHAIAPHQVLYVGNDMRNDIWPARATGLNTCLFAGDKRSLRLRQDDPAIRNVTPTLVATHLGQILDALG
jgi:putative hydrolase of the HAD superfamily